MSASRRACVKELRALARQCGPEQTARAVEHPVRQRVIPEGAGQQECVQEDLRAHVAHTAAVPRSEPSGATLGLHEEAAARDGPRRPREKTTTGWEDSADGPREEHAEAEGGEAGGGEHRSWVEEDV
jgi:hypothetical protein